MSNEQLRLENARKLRGIYFIDLEDKEFKETIKNARKKLETSVAPMPCKIIKNNKNCVGLVPSNKITTTPQVCFETEQKLAKSPKITSASKNSVILSGGDYSKNWGRPTTTADFRSSFRQIPYTSDVCLLEDKIQDRGMYLFAISCGSSAVDQRSGDG